MARDQLLDLGLTPGQIQSLLRSRELAPHRRGVYVVATMSPTWYQDLMGLCLVSPCRTWTSHRAAACLLDLDGFNDDVLEISTLADIRSRPDVVSHRVKTMLPCDVTTVRGIPCTEVSRTLLDLGAVAQKDQIEEALDSALRRRLTSLPRLRWRLTRGGIQGKLGASVLRDLVDQRVASQTTESILETKVLRLIRRGKLPPPELQHEVHLPAGEKVRIDFAYPSAKLAIEVVGYRWHGGRQQWSRDLSRSSDLGAIGWRVIYVTWDDVLHRPERVLDRLRRALGACLVY